MAKDERLDELEEWRGRNKKRRSSRLRKLSPEEREAFEQWCEERLFDVNEAEEYDVADAIRRWVDEIDDWTFG